MANKIQIKRGLSADISALTLDPGELGITLDTQQLYVGDASGVVKPVEGKEGPKGDTGDSGVYLGSVEPTDPDVNVWIDPNGEATFVPQNYYGTTAPTDDIGVDGDLYILIEE